MPLNNSRDALLIGAGNIGALFETIRRKAVQKPALDSLFIGQPLVDNEGRPDFDIQYRFLRQWLDLQVNGGINGFRPHPSDRSTLPTDLAIGWYSQILEQLRSRTFHVRAQ